MNPGSPDTARYLPTDLQARRWGWRLLGAGRQSIPPGAPYPGPGHPQAYLFDRDGRRTLDEFQIVFIERGAGVFESRRQPSTTFPKGHAALLFPGEWHRYRPHPAEGWTEYWAGFRGREAERIMIEFFSPAAPVIEVELAAELSGQFQRLLTWVADDDMTGREQIAASHLPMLLAFLSGNGSNRKASPQALAPLQMVARAKAGMLENLHRRTDLEALSETLGVSYSRFRSTFKAVTGFAPREFENRTKLNRARDLLALEGRSVSETAEALGYSSVFYFSRAFKKHFGEAPTRFVRSRG